MNSPHGKTRRIAMFLPSLAGGGAERVFVHLANQFVAWGREVELILLRREGPYLAQVDPRVRIVDLRFSNAFGVLALARHLWRERPAMLISAMDIFNVMALLAARLAGRKTPVIVTNHLHLTAHARHSAKLYARFLPFLAARLYPVAEHNIAVSEGVAEDLTNRTGIPGACITVIHNPVIILEKTATAVPHPWFLEGVPVVISAGRLDQQKDYPTLLAAFARVLARKPARLIILGEGPERAALEELVASLGLGDSVLLAGFVANPFAYFEHARLFVLSSRYEGFGMVIAEALACGCPVVATDCPSGPAEILDNGRYGTLVPVGDVEAMAQAIANAIETSVDRETLKLRVADFAIESVARRYLEVIDKYAALAGSKAAPV